MLDRYLADIADIMADRPIADEQPSVDDLFPGWRRRPELGVHGVEVWEAKNGELIGVASPALRECLRRAARTPTRERALS
jgi:hypothetical protein